MAVPVPHADPHNTPRWVWVLAVLAGAGVVFIAVTYGLAEGRSPTLAEQGKRGDVVARYHEVKQGIGTDQLRLLLGEPDSSEASGSGGPIRECWYYNARAPSRLYTFCFDGDQLTSKEWAPR